MIPLNIIYSKNIEQQSNKVPQTFRVTKIDQNFYIYF